MLKIYKASAGSGKTYTLAYEYIYQLLGVKDPRATSPTGFRLNHPHYAAGAPAIPERHKYILAITFTNKATEEMKRRIIDELKALSVLPAPGAGKDANYAKRLCEELQCTRQHLAEAADGALTDLLCDYGFFHVTTIDSFFQRVLRTFARELDRPGDFSIELNDDVVVNTAVDTMLDEFNLDSRGNKSLEQWLFNYLSENIESGQKSNFFNRSAQLHHDLVRLVENICSEKFKPYMAAMREYLSDMSTSKVGESRLARFADAVDGALKDSLHRMSERSKEFFAYMASVGGEDKDLQCIAMVRAMHDLEGGQLPSGKNWKKDYVEMGKQIAAGEKSPLKSKKGNPELGEMYADLLREQMSMLSYYKSLVDIKNAVNTLWLLAHAWTYVDRFVAENNTVLISDTNHMLQRIIGADETPFIYERMGVDLRHFLIDEFQDTSRMQWDNLRPLVANSMGGDYDNLIIGDEKQSIYRFRNSDSSLLHTEVSQVDFPAPRYNTRVTGGAPGENTNYRSAAHVVRFNNTFFTALAAYFGAEGYENVVQEISAKHIDDPGYVHIIPVDDNLMMKAMADNIVRQHDQGGYAWGDIAILTARRSQAASVIEYLTTSHRDIPVVSDEALYLHKSTAVQLVMGVLRMLAGAVKHKPREVRDDGITFPDKGEIAMMVSRYIYFVQNGKDEVEALDMAIKNENTPEQAVLAEKLGDLRQLKAVSIPALIENVIKMYVPEEDCRSQAAFLAAFQDYAVEYCNRYSPTLRAFVANWDRQKTLALQSGADIDAVKVMTIHKSKGLEFPCVHLPYASSWKSNKKAHMWVETPDIAGVDPALKPPALYVGLSECNSDPGAVLHKYWAREDHDTTIDSLNRTYVAYTRAGSELIVYYKLKDNFGKVIKDVLCMAGDRDNPNMCVTRDGLNADTGEYIYGEPTCKPVSEKEIEKDPEDNITLRLDTYRVCYNDDTRVLTRLDDVLDLADPDVDEDTTSDFNEYADEEARRRGILLHEVLSLIRRIDDRRHAVQMVRLYHRLDDQTVSDLDSSIDALLDESDPLVHKWFVDFERVTCEQPVYDAEDGRDYRIDRLVFNPDGSVDVVDYKFTTTRQASHRRQVGKYVRLIERMGYERVNGYLWYPLLDNNKQKI